MNDAEEMKHKIELLKMARELLNEEYINRRAEDHNQWLADCDVAWKTRGVKLPYPPFAPYPSEAEIVAKASSLFNFIKPSNTTNIPETPVPAESFLSKREMDTVSKIKFEPVPQPIKETPWEHYLNPKPEIPAVEPIVSTPESTVEIPKIETPWEQILIPKIEISPSLEVQTPAPVVADPMPSAATPNVPIPLPAALAPPLAPRTTPSAMIIDPEQVSEPVVEETPGPAAVSGIKNLLPSWLQRNQPTNKGTS
jgi:hypothetical protein